MHFDANSSQEQETEDNASNVLNDDLRRRLAQTVNIQLQVGTILQMKELA